MKSWTDYIAQQKARILNTPDLGVSLFENRLRSYLAYRFNYFVLLFAIQLSIFLTEYFLLSFIFIDGLLLKALALRLLLAILGKAWWGALEVLRERIREEVQQSKMHLVKYILSRWLSFSSAVSIISFISSFLLSYYMWGVTIESRIFALYTFAVTSRLAIQVFVLTLHSGIYATRRIFRPRWSIISLDLTGLILTLLFWPIVGEMSVPLGIICNTFISTAIVYHYITKAYSLVDYMTFKLSFNYLKEFFSSIRLKQIAIPGIAAALMKADALILMSALLMISNRVISLDNVNFYLVLLPFIQASSGWSGLFYFDFKRLENTVLNIYDLRFKNAILKLSLIVGPLLWCAYLCVSYLMPYSFDINLAFYFLPVFIVRAILAYSQIRAFS